MTIEATAQVMQLAFPRIYLACHSRHQRKRSTSHRLSPRDSAILAHLDGHRVVAAATLARHLGIGRPTLSEALKRLESLGFITRASEAQDRPRRRGVRLTDLGARAVAETSVLEADRLHRVLAGLTTAQRRLVTRAMNALSDACAAAAEAQR